MPALQREAFWAKERLLGDLRQSVPQNGRVHLLGVDLKSFHIARYFQNRLQEGRSNLVDPAESPKIGLLNRDLGSISSVFLQGNNSRIQSSPNFLQSGPRKFAKFDFSGLAPIRRALILVAIAQEKKNCIHHHCGTTPFSVCRPTPRSQSKQRYGVYHFHGKTREKGIHHRSGKKGIHHRASDPEKEKRRVSTVVLFSCLIVSLKSLSESVSSGVWCVAGFGADFEIALKPSKLQKEGEKPEKATFIFCAKTLVCTKPWFKRDLTFNWCSFLWGIARHVAKWDIAQVCLCETKYQWGGFAPLRGSADLP